MVVVLLVYVVGVFDFNLDLLEIMEGEVIFIVEDGKGEVFYVMIDYKRKVI